MNAAINGSKKAIIEFVRYDVVELRWACMARISILRQLIAKTHDIESRDELQKKLDHMIDLHDRLSELGRQL